VIGVRYYNTPLDDTIIQSFQKLKPEVFSSPRVLTDLLAPMEETILNILDYELIESPFLHTFESPYIHVGERINKVIYPKSAINIQGKRKRYAQY